MSTVLFISHPEVIADPDRAVPLWRLSEKGIGRMCRFAASAETQDIKAVWSSDETKAVEAAEILATGRSLHANLHSGLAENDRRSTGFLRPDEFERVADAFFAAPDESIRGWERAVDAQRRICSAVEHVLAVSSPSGDLAIVSHGGVGTLLLCHFLGEPISRRRDQPFQGHYWSFDRQSRTVMHGWRSISPT